MFKKLLNLGIFPELSFQKKNKLRVFNTACALVFAISVFYFFFGLFNGFYLAVLVSVFFVVSVVLSLYFVSKGRHEFAFHIGLICSFIFLTGFTVLFGSGSKSYFYFLFLPVASTILFDSKKIMFRYMIVSMICLLINVAMTEYTLPYYYGPYEAGAEWLFGYPNMLFAGMLIFMGLRIFKIENLKYSAEIEKQRLKLQEKNKEMTDSINYAKRIQYTLLAHTDLLQKNLPEHFVLFKPKDIVSGDFYWAARKEGLFYLAVCDSTGHGVPGAFMSLLNISFLNEAINEKNLLLPHDILNHVRNKLIENISQDGGRDGMDAVLFCFDDHHKSLTYAAANNAPLLIRNGKVQILPKDKMPVGGR